MKSTRNDTVSRHGFAQLPYRKSLCRNTSQSHVRKVPTLCIETVPLVNQHDIIGMSISWLGEYCWASVGISRPLVKNPAVFGVQLRHCAWAAHVPHIRGGRRKQRFKH